MAVTITRTPIIDDDKTGTTGTSLDNAWKQQLYDQIDGALVQVPSAPIPDASLSSNVALKNIDNGFVAQSLATGTAIRGVNPQLQFVDPTAALDLKVWRFINAAGTLYLQALNDANTVAMATMTFVRDGTLAINGGGITFPTAQIANAGANTLDDYEEGTWTAIDASGAGLVLVQSNGVYVKNGQIVTVGVTISFPTTANGALCAIGGLPFPIKVGAGNAWGGGIGFTSLGQTPCVIGIENTTYFQTYTTAGAQIPNSSWSGRALTCSITYRAAT
jgi:hypothetical protein